MVGVEPVDEVPVDEAPIGLYTKLRKTITFEMDVTHWKGFKHCTYDVDIQFFVPLSLN